MRLRRLRAAFAPSHLLVSADLEANREADWKAVSALCDYVVVMAYDENTRTPGPINASAQTQAYAPIEMGAGIRGRSSRV